ncbi:MULTISPECIES: tetratricopeptide repeat protein [Muribaculum]|jgi:tetratricopeptide (TPR) repeat protein|uniref:Tetratricopeptide repeat protein n=12 Tax=Muribaculum TaxID=1918540 RepID=A0A4P7VLP3_9BACT|nr:MULTISPECIES: tetratricopeptide repeat protein [Muribaculum]MCX4276743.1 tetratricopeptide repeat protein [Muribaculum sp.]QCD36016.1 tetratricopeptide repeat protein [Muribaculum gordoncarteri]ROT13630.1 tetratricopeptide repeat protein [Muribaculaceae bacterium Isolate-102 (HZI)]
MKLSFRKITLSVALAAIVVPLFVTAGKKADVTPNSDELKADYIFMEALRQHAIDKEDAYYDLLSRAYQLDPSNSDVGFFLGYYTVMTSGDDSTMFKNGYDLMKRHFNEAPADFYSNFVYGSINDRLGSRDEALKVWTTLDSIYPHKMEISYKLAEALASSGDSSKIARAIGVYDRIEKTQGKNIPLTTSKIRAFLSSQDTASIYKEVYSLLKSAPHSVENNVFAGNVFAMFSDNDSALTYFDKACDLDSTSGLAYYSRANFYKSIGDSVNYDKEVFRALSRESLELDAKLELLTGYIRELYDDPSQQGRIQELFATLLDQHPHEVDIHDLYCSYLIAIEDYAGAAEQLGYALDIDPSSEDRWRTLLSLYMQADDYAKSAEKGETALRYHPSSAMIHLMLGTDYNLMKEYDKALSNLNKSMELTDSVDYEAVSQIMSSMGDVYYAKGDRDSAFVYYDKAISIDPDNLLALNNCAYYLAVEGRDLDKAEEMSARTIKERPDDATSLDTYAWVMFRKKNYTEAMAYIDKAIANSEDPSEELYHHAGDIYFMNGEPQKALEFWEKALALDPDNELLQRKVKHKTYFYE